MDQTLYNNLQSFYNQQASKFSGTRKRHWPEFDHIIQALGVDTAYDIIELGCGDGRLSGVLADAGVNMTSYHGVDFSTGLISLAEKNYPDARWQVEDMIIALSRMESESADCLIAIASFQHLQNIELREHYLQECYRVLRYGGKLIMTNRSFSHWFLRRFWKQILSSVRKSFVTPTWSSNDIMVPWKKQDRSEIFHRYYHIFRLKELERLITQTGFIIETSGFVDKSGNLVTGWKDARNTLMVGVKKVFYDK